MKINEQLLDKIQHISNLPTLPQIASHLIHVINDPLTSASDVGFIIGQDLSLSAKVLRLANSAFYGIPRSITNINNAVIILGIKVINTMVLSLTVFDLFPENKNAPTVFDRKRFWLHSLSCGIIAKYLAAKVKKLILFDPEEAFCAGLLHDIGKVIMEQYLHDDFQKALALSIEKNITLYDAEMEIFGFSHSDVAEWLTQSWSLPFDIQLPMIYHHTPQNAPQCQEIVLLCHLADLICYEAGMSIDPRYKTPELVPGTVETLKLTPADIEDVKTAYPKELEKLSTFLEIARN
jgi:HD-like signal output (HDOD) protein